MRPHPPPPSPPAHLWSCAPAMSICGEIVFNCYFLQLLNRKIYFPLRVLKRHKKVRFFFSRNTCIAINTENNLPWSQRFFLIFLRERDQEQAVKRRQRVAKATRRERKTSGHLGLQSHFHADDSCKTRQIANNI